ncbi:hypothetical protein BDZ97DRAFT_1927820 [Flammula alnicola]|nr:hypothetical protein BDZ97DRAFT_1927820 [Flammula alnicola]
MASTSPDHFAFIRDLIRPTSRIFSSHRASGRHPPASDILNTINNIHGPLSKHLARYPNDLLECDALRAFATSLSVAAHELGSRPPAWNTWLIRKSPEDFNPDNHFLLSTRLLASYEYRGTPVEDSEEDAEASEESDSPPEVPLPSIKTGPPKKCKRVNPPAPTISHQTAPSPAPSISTHSRSQLKTAPPPQGTLPSKVTPVPSGITSSSKPRKASARATSPITKVAPSGSQARKTASVVAPPDSDGEQIDELADDPEPAPKIAKGKAKAKGKPPILPREVIAQQILSAPGPAHPDAVSPSQIVFNIPERLQNPGRCLACTTHLFTGEPHECKFIGWGRRCGPCQRGGKSRCTFELNPQELDQVLASISPLVSSSRHQLQVLVAQINQFLQDATLFAQLSACANRQAALSLAQLMEHARYLKTNFPPGHIVGPRFEGMDVLDTLLNGDYSLLDSYLDESANQPGFPPMTTSNGFLAKLPSNDASTALAYAAADTAFKSYQSADTPIASSSRQAPSTSSSVAATQIAADDLFNDDALAGSHDPNEPDDSREADELDELDDALMQTDN